ncbi:MAG: hypothetical protein NT040_19950 [Bacteroidetes bacterium]|nr:hypothetical protein [Bacteroidota bacterium]
MNHPLIIITALITLACSGFRATSPGEGAIPAAIFIVEYPCDSIPEFNRKIVELARQQIGTTVGRGECWDLAALVLNTNGAKWDKSYGFGRKVDPAKECVYPGDLIQFEGVQIKYTKGRTVYTETMGHHTAVINEVKSKGVFVLAHQNTGTSGRKVGLSDLDLKTIVKGKFQIYRPVM